MAAITVDGRQELVALYLTMFGQAPTAAKFAQLVEARENGSTLAQVATTLSAESGFALIAAKDADAFATYLADALLATDTPASARALAINWIVTQVQGTKTKAQVITEAVQAIRATTNTNYTTAKAELSADVELALQTINGSFSLTRAFEIGLDNLPKNYQLNSSEIDFGVNTVAELNEKILAAQKIIEKSVNSQEITTSYKYELKDEFENLNKNSLLVDEASSYSIIDASISLGDDLSVARFNSYELAQKLNIINNAENRNSLKLIYTIKDTLEYISTTNFEDTLNGASAYKISNAAGNLGIITAEQLTILQGAENYTDYTYINLEDVATVNAILFSFGITAEVAKSIILQHAENIDQIATALKQANLTAGEMAAILASSSGADDPPILLSENKIKEYFGNYVIDFRVQEGVSDIQGDSQDNILLGTNAAENFAGGDGEDSVVYDGGLSRYQIKRLYEGKSGGFSGYSIQDLMGSGSIDKLDADVEYIVFRDQNLKIPTTGILVQGTNNSESITGDSTNDILFGTGGYDTLTGGDGIDTAVFMGNLRDHQLTKLYEGKNGTFSGYMLSSNINGSDIAKITNDVEFVQFYDEKLELSTFLNENSQPLSFDITVADTQLKVGESTLLHFNFSDNVTGFSIEDVIVSGGVISNLRGLGDTYYALFKNSGEVEQATIDIKSGSVKSHSGDVYISDGIRNIDVILDLNLNDKFINPILNGGAGDDIFEVDSSGIINGGDGFDQLWINKNRDDYNVSVGGDQVVISAKVGVENSFGLRSIERVHFADKSLAFDMDGNAGVVASVLFNINGPDTLDVPLFVGVALGQLENFELKPVELSLLACNFFHGDSLIKAIFNVSNTIQINSGFNAFQTVFEIFFHSGIDSFMDELAKPPSLNHFANAELLGIKYLEYTPQYL